VDLDGPGPEATPVSEPPKRIEVAAPAKINLALLVGPRRPDGFHEICSVMVPVTLADLVVVERTPGTGLTVDCPVCPGDENLAARMVRELEQRLERQFEVGISIRKRIPHGAGLGGGSSDAAATLLALERLFDLDLAPRLRHEIVCAVGSDVPFFLWPGPQLAMGRGQVLKPLDLPEPLHIIIVLPDLNLSTRQVYGWRDEDARPPLGKFVVAAGRLQAAVNAAIEPVDLTRVVTNDLEASVVARHAEVGEARAALLAAGAYAAGMSGSGAAVFGLFADETAAETARERLAPARAWYVSDLQPHVDLVEDEESEEAGEGQPDTK